MNGERGERKVRGRSLKSEICAKVACKLDDK